MQSKKDSIKRLPVLRYSYTYAILAAFMILLLNLSSYASFRSLENKYIISNEKNLKQYKNTLEQLILDARNNTNILMTDDNHILPLQLLPRPMQTRDLYKVWKANRWLSDFFKFSRSSNLFLHFKNNDLFVSTTNVYISLEAVYGSLFQFDGLNYKDFLTSMDLIQGQSQIYPAKTVKINRVDKYGIVFARAIPNKYFENNVISYYLIESSYLDSLRKTILSENHTVSIYDTSGQLLYTSNNFHKVTNSNNKFIVSEAYSIYGFVCYSKIPRADAFSEFRYLKAFVVAINLFALLFAMLYIYYNSMKSIGKISVILDGVDKYTWERRESLFDYLNHSFAHLINHNNNLKNTIDAQIEIIKTSLLWNLIEGHYNNKDELVKDMRKISLNIPFSQFCVLVIYSSENMTDQTAYHIGTVFENRGITCRQGLTTVMVFMGFDDHEVSDYRRIIERYVKAIQHYIGQDTEGSYLYCCSDLFEDVFGTAVQYELCNNIISRYHQNISIGHILWSNDIQDINEQTLKKEIEDYIDEHFANPDLSLQVVAEHFQFSASYFSTIFKNSMDENYSSYLEKVRMRHADTLVCTTDFKIEEIAIRSGYNSSNTFLRAYKRHYGVSPRNRRILLKTS